MDITIERVPDPTAEAEALLAELDRTLAGSYTTEQRHGLPVERLFRPGIRFFIARSGGAAVGCGGIALLGTYAEVKRMYVRDAARRQGVGKALLGRIEQDARGAGLGLLRLETGVHQAAAVGLYERSGFTERGPFGPYADLAPRAIALSLFYEKRL
ncbi:MAG: GNAT family N-acetyltransferase [Acetobacteraceae bacterium]